MTAPGSLTRRTVLRRGAGVAALGVAGVPASAATPDDGEILALWAEYQAAYAEWGAAMLADDEALTAWYASADRLPVPSVTVQGAECVIEAQIEFRALDDERDAALAEFRRKEAEYDAASAKYGVPQAEAAEKAGLDRVDELLEHLAECPVNTLAGVAIKLRLLAEEARIEDRETDEELAETALDAVERLLGRAAC
jgi:hypothetical protein